MTLPVIDTTLQLMDFFRERTLGWPVKTLERSHNQFTAGAPDQNVTWAATRSHRVRTSWSSSMTSSSRTDATLSATPSLTPPRQPPRPSQPPRVPAGA